MKLHIRLFIPLPNGGKAEVEFEGSEIKNVPVEMPFEVVQTEILKLEQEINRSGAFRAHLAVS